MTLGQRLKELRLSLNLTLREAAKLVGTDFTYLSKIENDKTDHPPSEELLNRLASFYRVEPDELISLSGAVPKELQGTITKEALAFLRSAVDRNLSPDDWARLKDYMDKRIKPGDEK